MRGESTEARRTLDELYVAYWCPLFTHARQSSLLGDDASELAQGFTAQLLERGKDAVLVALEDTLDGGPGTRSHSPHPRPSSSIEFDAAAIRFGVMTRKFTSFSRSHSLSCSVP